MNTLLFLVIILSGTNLDAIIGSVVGGVILVAVVAICCFVYFKYRGKVFIHHILIPLILLISKLAIATHF